MPDGWAWSRFSSAFIINPRNNLPDETEVSFIPMPLIKEGYANNHTGEIKLWKKVKSGFTHFAEKDIGVAKITPCFENKKSVVFNGLKNGFGAGTTELHIMLRLFLRLVDGRKIITPVFWWQGYLGFYEMDNGTRLKLVYGQSSKGSTYLKQIEKL